MRNFFACLSGNQEIVTTSKKKKFNGKSKNGGENESERNESSFKPNYNGY